MKGKPCRNPCKECPYLESNKNNQNEKFKNNVKLLTDIGFLEKGKHTCHMIKTGWDKPNDKNICIGSLLNE